MLWQTLMRLVLAYSLYECQRVAVESLKALAASLVNYSRQQTQSSSEHYASDLSLMKADEL